MNEPLKVLLVEDNAGDVCLVEEAIDAAGLSVEMSVVPDGVEALAFLRKQGKYAGSARPDLILLDLNLPRVDGRQVLAEVKCDPDLRQIPIVVLTSSAAEQDIVKAYDLHANCYVVKPVDFSSLLQVVKTIEDFWFAIVKLPPNGCGK
jgi:two-component system, chemotaxis family, response regulator Rcp1